MINGKKAAAILEVLLAGLFLAGRPAQADLALQDAQGSMANASGVMDGSAAGQALAASPWLTQGVADPLFSGLESQALGTKQAQGLIAKLNSLKNKLHPANKPATALAPVVPDPAKPAARPPEQKPGLAKRFYGWMLRNPTEASFMAAIPMTIAGGFWPGIIAGGTLAGFLTLKGKKII